MKSETTRDLLRIRRALEQCVDELHLIHNSAYSRCDTMVMIASYPAWEGVKKVLDGMPQAVNRGTVKKTAKHIR